ncbi:MAG: hypothetical protein DME76_02530 [Verrucomicrobia bacterium]|nr:MAG: hypothetical protein DME76_02530 [Verrucomicrobiota bacterium]
MNNPKRSPTERFPAQARQTATRASLERVRVRFPSYLRDFDNFLPLFTGESRSGAARCFAALCLRFLSAPANVAFV